MRRVQTSTYTLRRRGLANLRPQSPKPAGKGPDLAIAGAPADHERRRRNFEQRRLEHLRERWRSQRGTLW